MGNTHVGNGPEGDISDHEICRIGDKTRANFSGSSHQRGLNDLTGVNVSKHSPLCSKRTRLTGIS